MELRQIFVLVDEEGREVDEAPSNFQPNADIRPTTQQWIIRAGARGPGLARARWGLVPFFHKGPMSAFKLTTFNAMSETAHEKASFKGSLQRRRALIPTTGWWEWTPGETPKDKKLRWSFTHGAGEIITLAGLWERAHTADGPIESFTIMTQPSDGHLTDYHHRAPVVIRPADRKVWLDHHDACVPSDLLTRCYSDEINVRRAVPSEDNARVVYV